MADEKPQVVRDALIRYYLTVENSRVDGVDGKIHDDNPVLRPNFFFGNIRTFTPPDLSQKNAPWPTMGDGQLKIDLGLEQLDFTFVTARYSPGVRSLYGKHIKVNLKAGLWQGDTKRHAFYEIEASGDIEKTTGSQVSIGETPEGITVMMNCHTYKERGSDFGSSDRYNAGNLRTFIDIDIGLMHRVMDGKDQLEELRDFFGI